MARTANVVDAAAVRGEEPFSDEQQENLQVMHRDAANRAGQIAAQYGDGLPYERERVVREAQFFMAQSAEAMLEAGKRLIELKENEPHGEFVAIVEERLGLASRTARLMMQASVKFMSPQLESKRQALAVLGKTKLFELMTSDDEDLAELAEGGTVAGLTLDDVERMTTRELKAALREAREQEDAANRMIRDKSGEVDDLRKKLIALERKKAVEVKELARDDVRNALMQACTERAFVAEGDMRGNLRQAVEELMGHAAMDGDSVEEFVSGLFAQLERTVKDVRDQFGVKAVPDGNDRPEWLPDEDEVLVEPDTGQ